MGNIYAAKLSAGSVGSAVVEGKKEWKERKGMQPGTVVMVGARS